MYQQIIHDGFNLLRCRGFGNLKNSNYNYGFLHLFFLFTAIYLNGLSNFDNLLSVVFGYVVTLLSGFVAFMLMYVSQHFFAKMLHGKGDPVIYFKLLSSLWFFGSIIILPYIGSMLFILMTVWILVATVYTIKTYYEISLIKSIISGVLPFLIISSVVVVL